MCGIYISVGFPPDPAHIDVVAHRGPDGRGWRVFDSPAGPVALGHRRLSIIDLDDRALQPMSAGNGRYWLCFNGEIYNYLELQAELRAAGETFETTSDVEVLLKACIVWGKGALDRLVGMFAFAFWDDQEKTLLLVRDRMGVKPLVYHASDRGAAFASEIKQLIDLPGFQRRINMSRAHNFLATGVTDHLDETMFADARNLGPGRFIELDLKTWRPRSAIEVRDYWKPPAPSDRTWSEAEAADRFRELFFDSMKLHTRADVRVGSCLSGGLDSSSIVAVQSKIRPADAEPVQAISAVFPDTPVDETKFIDAAIERSGAQSTRVTLSPEHVFEDVEAIVRTQDEPYGSTSIHAQYHVFRKAREIGVKVMLDGQGADEILGGYHGCFDFHYMRLIRQAQLLSLIQTLQERKNWHGVSRRQQLWLFSQRLPPPFRQLLRPPGRGAPPPPAWMATDLLQPHAPIEGGVAAQACAREGLPVARTLGDYCVTLARTTNLPMLLRYEDRNSMAHSIEARVPFLDHRLVEFALQLGDQHKIVGGDTKRVLRSAMADILPDPIRFRRDKLGFATPEELWFKGPLRSKVEAGVEETLTLYPGLLDPAETRRLTRQVLDGERPFDFTLWRILVFGVWGRQYRMTI